MSDQSLEQQAFQKKLGAYLLDKKKLEEKHGIVDVPILSYTEMGMFPVIVHRDKAQYEHMLQQMTMGAMVAVGGKPKKGD
jgi:hypothetical protein